MSLGEIAEFFLPKNVDAKQVEKPPVVTSQIPNEIRERRNKFAAKTKASTNR